MVSGIIDSLRKTTVLAPGLLHGIEYGLNEISDNVLVHSTKMQSEHVEGYVMAQVHRQSNKVAIAVYDDGIGIPDSLRSGGVAFADTKEAIQLALSKGVTDGNGAGNGLWLLDSIVDAASGSLDIQSDGIGYRKVHKYNGVDAIFYPCMSYNLDEHLGDNHYNCPVVAYYPEVLEGNCPELKATKFIYDYFNLERRKDFYKKFQQTLDHYFPGLDRKAVHEAIDAAYDEYARHMQQLRDKGTEIIAQARREGRRIIVLAGRPYHVDPEVNHGIDQLIIRQGAAVISEDSVSWHEQKFQTSVLNQWTYHSRLYAAAKYCTENPDMDLVQLVSFGCGLDAVTTDETREILQAGSKLYTQLKIDEITNLGAVNIRLRSLFAALEERKEDKK